MIRMESGHGKKPTNYQDKHHKICKFINKKQVSLEALVFLNDILEIFMKGSSQSRLKRTTGGYALVTALIFFLTASLAVVIGISDAVFLETRSVRNESSSKQSYFVAESGAEDVTYRIKNNQPYSAVETYTLGPGTALVTSNLGPGGMQSVKSRGDVLNTQRNLEINLNAGNEISFPYALQGGVGGIDLSGGATIQGDIYTTGSIRGCGTCTVQGAAVAAGKSTSNLDQSNTQPAVPVQSIAFGTSNTAQDLAQSFSVSSTLSLTDLKLVLRKVGNPANATVRITTDNAGRPSGTILASGTVSSPLVSTSYGLVDITLTASPVLTAGTTYWIVIDSNTSASNYYMIGANTNYANGQAKIGRYGNNSWNNTTPVGLDAYFEIYIGQNQEGVTGENQWNQIPVSSAYSYEATYVNASGALYCQIGVDNNKACDTSRADPAIEPFPVADAIIAGWKTDAETNIHTGDYVVGWAGDVLGPIKIEGDLYVSSGGELRIADSVWVTGSIVINGGARITPDTGTKSHAVIADGTINLSGGADIAGNGTSQILLVSMSTADPALTINGGANDTVVFVPRGGLLISGGATVNAAAAKHITATGGSIVIYDPIVSKLNITSGAGGVVDSRVKLWKEIE